MASIDCKAGLRRNAARACLPASAVIAMALVPLSAGAEVKAKLLYTFHGASDGAYPAAAVIEDDTGAIYGTTELGGGGTVCTGGCGVVYKLTLQNGTYRETVLHRFQAGTDGANPEGRLLIDSNGDLFGTTVAGGSTNCTGGCGTVFELVPTAGGTYKEKILYAFKNSPDGAHPHAALLALKPGTFLGTATAGGSSGYGCYGVNSTCGVVFKLTLNGKTYKESIAYSFLAPPDASAPFTDLIESKGSIFGVGVNGGAYGCVAPNYDCGTVFQLQPIGSGYSESVLTLPGWNGDSGPNPIGGLAKGADGVLFGAATSAFSVNGGVFALTPGTDGYTAAYPWKFTGSPDASHPQSAPIVDKSGAVYGTTANGGTGDCNCGAVYQIVSGSSGYVEQVVYSFARGAGGMDPVGSLLEAKKGGFIGTASQGGSDKHCDSGCGTVFELTGLP